jgi:hypothetical protein
MTTKELLIDRGVTSALIVDDAYDAAPLALDISGDDEAWSNFLADIGEDRKQIREIFPDFDSMDASELRRSDKFVSAMWGAREKIRPELWKLLFSTYEQATRSDRGFLERLEEQLKALGVTPIQCGRQISASFRDVPLIFVDLYLGAAQESSNIDLSLDQLRLLLKGRENSPPLVILMSRSDLLDDKKARFRDNAKLLGAMFRVYRKQELLEGDNLQRALERLALHKEDAIRVAQFLHCWEKGLEEASARFLSGIRRLDLSDYAQIRQVLLAFEGQPLGSYLLDVFDRVLQHEIEGDAATIGAAEQLNVINPEIYPAPYISGSIDLQDLVYRSIWQHPLRLQVKTTEAGIPVGLGDVLVRRSILTTAQDAASTNTEPDAFVVLTPACDLVREGAVKRILLVAGKLLTLTPKTWTYSEQTIKTPIIVLGGESRMWIRWDVKDLRMLLPTEIEAMLSQQGSYQIALRLRESHALELQQRVLSSMGRVGLVTPMPATFPVEVSAYYLDVDGTLQPFNLPITAREGGVCYTGRDANGEENSRLVLTEPAIDELLRTIANIAEETVNARAHDTLRKLKASTSLGRDLQRGLKAPVSSKSSFQQIKATSMGVDGQAVEEVVGMVARNPVSITDGQAKYKAFVLVLRDEQSQNDQQVEPTAVSQELSTPQESPDDGRALQ